MEHKNKYSDEDKEKAVKLWLKMRPQIESLANKIKHFPSFCDRDDFINGVSYLACYKSVKKYDCYSAAKMDIETYAYWQIKRAINCEADRTSDVIWVGTTIFGDKIILTNQQYRKKKKQLEAEGYKFESERTMISFELFNGNGNFDNDDEESDDDDTDGSVARRGYGNDYNDKENEEE